MSGTFLLARRHLWHHKGRSAVLVACLTLTFSLPLGMELFSRHVETRLSSRAASTPMIIGAAGSRFDLALHALYFRGQPPRETNMREVQRVADSGFATAIPMLARFKAEGFPIVGTTPAYLSFRRLRLAIGDKWSRYGDCIVGANVADRLKIGLGDSVTSEPENLFELDSSFPLKMRVSGVLARTDSPDDDAIFVDIHTAWIIAGIGHGHAPASRSASQNETNPESPTDGSPPAHDASLIEYTEIDESNAASFHFHGEREDFPVTAIIAIPNDNEAETLLMGRYLDADDPSQVLQPTEVIDELLSFVVQLRRVFAYAFAAMSSVTVALLALLIVLTVKLRDREFQTMFRLGGSRFLIVRLVGAELLILISASGVATLMIICGLSMMISQLSFVG
ncbi:MAG: putative ABC transport system permease protein [Planctomycetaceae bacterium]|jgi:putative ABC transport system permease protein